MESYLSIVAYDDILGKITENGNNLSESIPKDLEEMLTGRFQIDGVMPLTRGDITSLETSMLKKLQESIEKLSRNNNQTNGGQQGEEERNRMEVGQGARSLFLWGGAFYYVPQDFELS